MEKYTDRNERKPAVIQAALENIPSLLEHKKNCDNCNYRDQDIDCHPCDRCHTRH